MIDFAECVEAHITSISVLESSRRIEITFESASSRSFKLVVEDADRFMADEMREKNIVDRLTLWGADSEPSEYRDALTLLVSGSKDSQIDKRWLALIDNEVASIRRGEKIFVEIEPVYGVSIALLARAATLVAT